MKYIQEFRSGETARSLAERIRNLPLPPAPVVIMEVCGSHTMAIHRFGIRQLLPPQVRLISGPGCPVCVTDVGYVDRAVAIGRLPDVMVATFGDMMKIPGSETSLTRERAAGRDIRTVYSTLDALALARDNPRKQVVFLGIGFETTSPTIAISIREARRQKLPNYSVLIAHKLIPPAMGILARDPAVGVNGYLCPAHVSAIIGTRAYEFLPAECGVGCAVAGFEPLDILQGVYLLLKQIASGAPAVENEYSRVVKPGGNEVALRILEETFEVTDDAWRGLGVLPASGYKLRPEFAAFDAVHRFPLEIPPAREPAGCLCGEVLKGIKEPAQCPLFGEACTPEAPVGACMVSSEGTCAAWFKYGHENA